MNRSVYPFLVALAGALAVALLWVLDLPQIHIHIHTEDHCHE